jgi:hypothetical protein
LVVSPWSAVHFDGTLGRVAACAAAALTGAANPQTSNAAASGVISSRIRGRIVVEILT